MLTERAIIDFITPLDYDVRTSHNGRWIDQKCTPDVLSFIADCISNYQEEHPDAEFRANDIWLSKYAVENTELFFKKPSPEQKAAKNEYDKFFQQPMKLLSHSGVLSERKDKNKNVFKVENKEVLEYVALSERNALIFLRRYIEKVLRDSGLYDTFENFFQRQGNAPVNKSQMQTEYSRLKNSFYDFTHSYTAIKRDLECGRIFTKVLNPLAYFRNALGTEKGHLSKDVITYDALMYNQNNFRDIYTNKPKGITRKEYARQHPVEINEKYYEYQSTKAKRFLKAFNIQYRSGLSEHIESGCENDSATHIHHIFPKAQYPEICSYLENLIALTPTQHFNRAHPNGNTQEINAEYQKLLLMSKASQIKENIEKSGLENVERIYELSRFLHVLSVGFDDDTIEDIPNADFASVMNAINVHYENQP